VGGGLLDAARRQGAQTDPSLNVAVVTKTIRFVPTQLLPKAVLRQLKNVDSSDTWEAHAFDTVKGSDCLADQDRNSRR